MKQVYLIHSSDAKWVTRQREALIDDIVPREMREESLLEIFSTSSRSLDLGNIFSDVISELATIPMLPDSRRVVVLHNLSDILRGGGESPKTKKAAAKKAGKKKAAEPTAPTARAKLTPLEILADFIQRDLPATENALILSNIIEYDRNQEIDDKGAFYQMLERSPICEIIKPSYKEVNPIWQMGDALIRRDTAATLRHFRALYRDDMRGRLFGEILRNVRFILQAKVLSRIEKKGTTSREIIEMKYLPHEKKINLYQQAEFLQKKYKQNAENFQLRELMQAMDRLLAINRMLYPPKDATYVPDLRLLLETFIVEFCETGRKRPSA